MRAEDATMRAKDATMCAKYATMRAKDATMSAKDATMSATDATMSAKDATISAKDATKDWASDATVSCCAKLPKKASTRTNDRGRFRPPNFENARYMSQLLASNCGRRSTSQARPKPLSVNR